MSSNFNKKTATIKQNKINSIMLHIVYQVSVLGLCGKALLVAGTAGMESVRQDL